MILKSDEDIFDGVTVSYMTAKYSELYSAGL